MATVFPSLHYRPRSGFVFLPCAAAGWTPVAALASLNDLGEYHARRSRSPGCIRILSLFLRMKLLRSTRIVVGKPSTPYRWELAGSFGFARGRFRE